MSTEKPRELRWNRGVELRPRVTRSIEPPANAAAERSVRAALRVELRPESIALAAANAVAKRSDRAALRVELRPESLALAASGIDPLNEAAIVFAETIQVQTNKDIFRVET